MEKRISKPISIGYESMFYKEPKTIAEKILEDIENMTEEVLKRLQKLKENNLENQ